MTRFENALTEAAKQAPPLGDIADRALAQSRRRRLRVGVPLAAVAVAASTGLVAVAVTSLPGGGSSDVTTGPAPAIRVPSGTLQFPDQAEPLPDKGVAPVALAYSMTCDEQANDSQCQWRVMTADGDHRTVPDAAHPQGGGELADRGLVTVSPDGGRIGYFRDDARFVLRDLDTGQVEEAFTWKSNVLNKWPETVWSSNGRWLAVSYLIDTFGGEAVLVDTKTMTSTDLPKPKGLFLAGIHDNGEPLYQKDIPDKLAPSQDGWSGTLSPDGNTLAALTYPKSEAQVNVIDVAAERLDAEYPIDRDVEAWNQPTFAGWADRSRVLVYTFDVSGSSDPNQYKYPGNVDTFDVRTGKLDRVFHLPDSPRGVSVAAGLIGDR